MRQLALHSLLIVLVAFSTLSSSAAHAIDNRVWLTNPRIIPALMGRDLAGRFEGKEFSMKMQSGITMVIAIEGKGDIEQSGNWRLPGPKTIQFISDDEHFPVGVFNLQIVTPLNSLLPRIGIWNADRTKQLGFFFILK